jgi:hypothetical protein
LLSPEYVAPIENVPVEEKLVPQVAVDPDRTMPWHPEIGEPPRLKLTVPVPAPVTVAV